MRHASKDRGEVKYGGCACAGSNVDNDRFSTGISIRCINQGVLCQGFSVLGLTRFLLSLYVPLSLLAWYHRYGDEGAETEAGTVGRIRLKIELVFISKKVDLFT